MRRGHSFRRGAAANCGRAAAELDQFQEKHERFFHSELRQDKEMELIAGSVKRRNALREDMIGTIGTGQERLT
jgi:hypothetical protein